MFDDDQKSAILMIKKNNKLEWEQLRKSYDKYSSGMLMITGKEIDLDQWNTLIDKVKGDAEGNRSQIISLADGYDNNARISTYRYSSWETYKKSLENKHWSQQSIQNIEDQAHYVLTKLQTNNKAKNSCKGLVVGDIQSGKTANMTALIAQAADNGFNVFIILSGIIDSLRQQTSERIYGDLASNGSTSFHWKNLDNPSLKNNNYNLNVIDLGKGSKNKVLIVSLKNKTRLTNLYNWLRSNKTRQAQMKVLVIDDEADQASINTKDVSSDEQTAINSIVRKIANDRNFGAMNYIAYTATPFANVLNEFGDSSLYPKDFIELLQPAEDYIGAQQIFGTIDPEDYPSIKITQLIPKEDIFEIKRASRGKKSEAPKSLKDAINWFLIAMATMRSYGYKKPISMMVHTSFRVLEHEYIAKLIENYLSSLTEYDISKMHELYIQRQADLSLDRFLLGMPKYTKTKDDIHDYPDWSQVESELKYLLNLPKGERVSKINMSTEGKLKFGEGIHLCIDNGRAGLHDDTLTRLIYPKEIDSNKKAPAFIVVGGNTLSRGLTIQGLVSSYFLRTTNQADTLMQMARWFGYRQGYELFPRVWMDENAYKRYQFLSQINLEMRQTMAAYATNGITPTEFAPQIKASPNYAMLRLTSGNKMQSAEPAKLNFSGVNPQTIIFENDKDVLEHNIKATENFLTSLQQPIQKNDGHLVWLGVPVERIINYLEDYKSVKQDRQITNIPNLIYWLSQNVDNFKNWDVVVVSPNKMKKLTLNSIWKFGNFTVNKVNRSRRVKSGENGLIDIGALLTPKDLLADIIDPQLTKEEIHNVSSNREIILGMRSSHGLKETSLLVIYCIDKNSKGHSKNKRDLDAVADIIGLSVLIPGIKNGRHGEVKSVSIDLSKYRFDEGDIGDNIDENDFEDRE
ncbi:hypothetical protein ME796_16760 [Lactobacillus delbrueckii]|uniref:Z1 domain-containing protein n=1 Tax=Lactobacillus delbrueckii TaxID=1584 RepID=UPI001F3B28F4|nr:Z1 domain-containing protein [Lactobacillus delbrueckii]GHN42327.1 hypothetical protein ME796_16760 [Lactobacillus delbrueckii]